MAETTTPFLTGWNRLPDELKLQILKETVPRDTYFASSFKKEIPHWRHRHVRGSWRTMLPLLSIPQIKGLALEAFYSQNEMGIMNNELRSYNSEERSVIYYPPRNMRDYITKLYIRSCPSVRTLELLINLGSGSTGMNHLRSVTVVINGSLHWGTRSPERAGFLQILATIDKIEFRARTLMLRYLHDSNILKKKMDDMVTDDLDMLILEKFSLQGRQDKVEEVWTRYKGHGSQEVDAWSTADQSCCGRITSRILSI
ncbi:uncharacterized protein K460DRAFT_367913 [Cucurbitaria berberidis CBS 394.84]|uniref:F-box domain-containing protein n=1 Tax=Cucurbitaria berberidis CBS 394.84 TaxID=1168544 RepID=A0A9P4L6F1_9PLEO|nr:uncharacterized protein K460DRAFT_367913 [Cucurbitaria berberidis CBS 394.84]KAF1842993.1 hypothetical protein K460DRAFT_367913 [Cucurbitaria berberidis CBS 394.84]